MSRTNKRLTEAQFNQVVRHFAKARATLPGPDPSGEAEDIARRVLVGGQSRVAVAREYGVTRQYIDKVANRYYDGYFTEVAGFPKSWKTQVVHGAPAFIKKVTALEKAEHEAFFRAERKKRQ